ncbi:MAG: MraY family glycosyltransferase [Candidatus Limnocylindrales bacterium]|nr:MraY family glycosyltransferase [Candidatus Limnocylindrales bacterium]
MTLIPGIGTALGPIVAVFLAAALLSFFLTPQVRRIVLRYRIVDRPGARRVNLKPVPRSGGLAVAAAFLAVAGVFLVVNDSAALISVPPSLRPLGVAALLLGGAVAAGLGAIDDLLDLRARWQFLGQVALATGAVALGIGIDIVNNPFGPGIIVFPTVVAIAFTIFWIVGMINSINWIDGLDGLSSGVAIIAAVTLGLISLSTRVNQPLIAVLCFILAGALLGFLRWNFHPATIFTGTSGVQFVGYTLAVLSILGTAKVAVALLVLGVPIIDTFWIIVRRLSQGRSPFSPDRQHIHHRLLDLGLSHRQTVLVIYGVCTGLAVLALILTGASQLYAFLGVFIASGLVLFLPTRGDFGRPDELEAESYEPDPPTADPSG